MIVTFISQCEKKSLNKTRRVLDAFANRIGDNSWQTMITNEGLNSVKKLLRKTASKNTAVSCHWVRSRSRSELMWIIGNRDKFDSQGKVPVNTTGRDLLKSNIENDWHFLPLIKALTGVASLLHDWGKSTALFQLKLDPTNQQGFKGDPIRHEWISCLLLNAFVSLHADEQADNDTPWLKALSQGELDEAMLLQTLKTKNESKPLSNMPPMAQIVLWLILTHHRLPVPGGKFDEVRSEWNGVIADSLDRTLKRLKRDWGYENRRDESDYAERFNQCFQFPNGLLSQSKPWAAQLKKWARRLLACKDQAHRALEDGSYRVIVHHARLALMLGDHFYSSQQADPKWPDAVALFANTDRKTKQLKQRLDEHLVGVARCALNTAHLLPAFEKEPPSVRDTVNLKKRSPAQFRWQDVAVEKILKWQRENNEGISGGVRHGFFAVNMASTGCGKTFANAKVMRALSEANNSLRYILALGLRTLTLQTGDEYRDRVGLDESELAVLIGSRAVMELHQQNKLDEAKDVGENTGSLSQEALLDEIVDYECAIPEDGLATVLTCERDRKFLYAPVLVCTIDHMMAATETKRGGRYILPSLRLMSSDLVIDEVDDFTGDDLIAIGRLIHLAGMLGRKVMISSATIPPDLAEGFFKAYRAGWRLFGKTRDASHQIGCAWIDEFSTSVTMIGAVDFAGSMTAYRNAHAKFIDRRVKNLLRLPARRKAKIKPCQFLQEEYRRNDVGDDLVETRKEAYFHAIAREALALQGHHSTIDERTGLSVSFGVIRVANITPCVSLTQFLLEYDWPTDIHARIMAYHSQQTLLMRNEQERHLDQVLTRKEKEGEEPKAFTDEIIREHLDSIYSSHGAAKRVMFILVATPVEEVGRDHDFDWAVVEPSSYRSIVQLAGRVRRHRQGEIDHPNIALMQFNWKAVKQYPKNDWPVFVHPGFESRGSLKSHDLYDLMDDKMIGQRLDATPRIQKPPSGKLNSEGSLADLEHKSTERLLTNKNRGPAALNGYLYETWFLTALCQTLTVFRQSSPSLKVFLVYDDCADSYVFCEKDEQGQVIEREKAFGITHVSLTEKMKERLWLERSYVETVQQMARDRELSCRAVTLRYGELTFRRYEGKSYMYSDQLGIVEE